MYNVKFVRDRKPRKLVFKADRKMKVYEGTGINYKRIPQLRIRTDGLRNLDLILENQLMFIVKMENWL